MAKTPKKTAPKATKTKAKAPKVAKPVKPKSGSPPAGDANAHYNRGLELMKQIESPLRSQQLNSSDQAVAAEAEKELTAALDIAENHGRAHIMIGMLYRYTQRLDQAEPHLRRALTLPPASQDWSTAADTLASVYMEQNRFPDAIKLLEQAIKNHPREVLAYYKLGASYFLSKNLKGARKALEAGLKVAPDDPRLKESLEEIRNAELAESGAAAPGVPPEYAAKQKKVEAMAKKLQATVQKLMMGPGSPEEKSEKMMKLQQDFQAEVQKMYSL